MDKPGLFSIEPMTLLTCLLLTTTVATAASTLPHVLSETPSWMRQRPDLYHFFAADMDAAPIKTNATAAAASCDCSGRGDCAGDSGACECRPGYSGARCEFAGPSWTILPQPGLTPKSRAHHSLTAVGERLYLFGGATFLDGKAHRLNDLHYYTPSTRRWTTPYAVGHWPAHRSGHTATLVPDGAGGPRLFLFGGIDGDGGMTADLDVYEVNSQRWRRPPIERAPQPRARHAAVALGGTGLGSLWIFGGAVRPPPLTAEQAANAAAGHPSGSIVGSDARHYAAAQVGMQLLDDVHVLDTEAEPPVWYTPRVTGEKPPARCGHSATLLADELSVVVFGGEGKSDLTSLIDEEDLTLPQSTTTRTLYNDVWVFSFSASWKKMATSGVAPVATRHAYRPPLGRLARRHRRRNGRCRPRRTLFAKHRHPRPVSQSGSGVRSARAASCQCHDSATRPPSFRRGYYSSAASRRMAASILWAD